MGYRQDNKFIIYPIYFDATRSRKDGRRVPKKLSIEKPTIIDISKAAKNLGYNPVLQQNSSHPKYNWRNDGRILVDKKGSKNSMITQIAKSL